MAQLSRKSQVVIASACGILALALLAIYYPAGNDWRWTFSILPQDILHPYEIPSFANPPWILLFLWHAVFPESISNAVNLLANSIVILLALRKFNAPKWVIPLIFTNPAFFELARMNNVDWIPMLVLLLPTWVGFIAISAKPQMWCGYGIVLALREIRNSRWGIFVPLSIITALSFAIWGFWPAQLHLPWGALWNMAPWPFGIPVGIIILALAIKRDDEFLGALASPFLVPYFATPSVAGLFAYISAKRPQYAIMIWVVSWTFVVVALRRSTAGAW